VEGQVPVFISPRNKVAQLYHRALGIGEFEVKVKLRPTVSRPVCVGIWLPFGARDQIFVLCLTFAGLMMMGALSDELMGL
jgi:hypothetical protein